MTRLAKQQGFTLIELAIVLVIIGVLAGSFIATLSSRIDATRVSDTNDEIRLIKKAITGFAYSQPGVVRIPCPDCNNAACVSGANVQNDGVEDIDAAGACDANNQPGNLPWVSLGVGRSDAWGTHYSYWAADAYANTAGFTLASSSAGTAQVNDTTAGGAVTIANTIAAVVFSHGKDSFDGISEDGVDREGMPGDAAYNDQLENTDVDAGPMVFISRPISGEGANVIFDDIVSWISEFELKANTVEAGRLP